MRHLRPIPDNIHHALYISYAIQCTNLAHVKPCSISPLKFKWAHRNKWPNSNILVRIKYWERVSVCSVARSMSCIATVLRCPPFEVVDTLEMLKFHQLLFIELPCLLVQNTFETTLVEGWQACHGFLALLQSSMWCRVPLVVKHLMCSLCTHLARKDHLLWPRRVFVETPLGNF